jgi:hypothetical protein
MYSYPHNTPQLNNSNIYSKVVHVRFTNFNLYLHIVRMSSNLKLHYLYIHRLANMEINLTNMPWCTSEDTSFLISYRKEVRILEFCLGSWVRKILWYYPKKCFGPHSPLTMLNLGKQHLKSFPRVTYIWIWPHVTQNIKIEQKQEFLTSPCIMLYLRVETSQETILAEGVKVWSWDFGREDLSFDVNWWDFL